MYIYSTAMLKAVRSWRLKCQEIDDSGMCMSMLGLEDRLECKEIDDSSMCMSMLGLEDRILLCKNGKKLMIYACVYSIRFAIPRQPIWM